MPQVMPRIGILIADDHTILRAGLQMLINAQPDMTVVGEAKNGRETLRKTRELQPDILLTDITMPGTSGLKVIDQVLYDCPQVRVVVLTMHEDPAYARSVLVAGASAYVIKRAGTSDLLAAIRSAYQGQVFVDATLGGASLLHDLLGKKQPVFLVSRGAPRSLLTPREREVFALLAHGYTNRQVADRMFISVKTVETHRSKIVHKLNLRSRADLIRYAIDCGLLSSQQSSCEHND